MHDRGLVVTVNLDDPVSVGRDLAYLFAQSATRGHGRDG
jgi:hypothetical protein